MTHTHKTAVIVAALGCFASSAHAQGVGTLGVRETRTAIPLEPHRTGEMVVTLPDRSPLSGAEPWTERFHFPGSLEGWDYDLSTETFSLYVPPEYDRGGESYGVVVWVSAREDGAIPEDLKRIFDQRKLIWIGANGAGNERHIFPRAGLALDAAYDIERAYHVDRDRIFVAGLSGGGRMAAMLAVDWSDVFAGGFPIIGVTTYQSIPLESNPDLTVTRYPTPDQRFLERARSHPFVIMTGSGDFNREECQLTAAAHQRDGFEDLHLIDIDGMEHEMPSPTNFALGLDLLLSATD